MAQPNQNPDASSPSNQPHSAPTTPGNDGSAVIVKQVGSRHTAQSPAANDLQCTSEVGGQSNTQKTHVTEATTLSDQAQMNHNAETVKMTEHKSNANAGVLQKQPAQPLMGTSAGAHDPTDLIQGNNPNPASVNPNGTMQTDHAPKMEKENELIEPPADPLTPDLYGCPPETELPRYSRDWNLSDYNYFVHLFNNANSLSEVKKKCHNVRTEKIAQLVLTAQNKGCKFDEQKIYAWLIAGENPRGLPPIIKVCKDDYLRISAAQLQRFGVNLKQGQEYCLSTSNEGGKVKIHLELIA